MAEKDSKPKATAKPASAAKPAAKPAAATKPAAKSAATAKTASSTTKPAAKTTAAAKPAAKSAAKPSATAKTASSTTKPAAKTTAAAKPATATTAKPVTAVKPAASAEKPATKTEATAKTAAAVSPKKEKKAKTAKKESGSGKASVAALIKNNKVRFIISAAVAFVLILAIIVGVVVGTKSCKKTDLGEATVLPNKVVANDNPTTAESTSARPIVAPVQSVEGEKFENQFTATTAVGFSAEVLGTVERRKPVAETKDEGLPSGYPKYGYTLQNVIGSTDDKKQARAALINESDYLTAYGTRNNSGNGNNGDASYTWMDENGYLYSGSTADPVQAVEADGTTHRQLYKHTAAEGMYFDGFNNSEPLSDSEPGIVKQVTIRPRGYGSYSVTGVYAPAGEVIKIEISEADMNATGGLTIHIGQALYNGQSNNIWVDKGQMQRFPNILNTMNVNKNTATLKNGVYTAYVGSFIGGPLYIRNTSATFTAKISGGVAYSHFILGYTTKEEFEKNKKSTAPYFDLEVWNYGVLHSGPKIYAQNFSYEDLYKAAVLWEKVSSVTTTGSSQGIVFLYDPFVAAGAAVAFPGRSSVNCPTGWMSNSLNYNSIVSSGAWGNFHEYHHNFQGYGVGNGGEVTNNGMTLVSYALFTKISSKRGIASYGAQGLGGWNNYTSATWALNDILSLQRGGHPSNGDQGLALYATLLHNFGANNYIQAKVKGGGQSYQAYANAWEAVTHNNMSYYFNDVLKGNITSTAPNEYPMFVPVSSVYQTGRSYMYDGEKKYFQTMQPYVIPYGVDFNIDLSRYTAPSGQYASGSVVIPDNFDYRIKSITQPENGKIEVVDDYNFKFKPNANKLSGQIVVTLEIKEKNNKFKVDDVDLILEFEQSHETNKMTLERTTYTYTAETMYTDAKTAYENNFKGYTGEPLKWDHTNPTQNCNTDIWLCTPSTIGNFPKADPDKHVAKENTIEVLNGKLYFQEAGKYRIYLRGRENCAVFISYEDADGKQQKASAQVTKGSGSGFYTNDPKTYIDITVGDETFVDFTEVLIVKLINGSQASYLGLGYGQWSQTMFTIEETYHKADNTTVESPDDDNYQYTKTTYRDYRGNEVAYSRKDKNSAETLYFKKVGNNYVASNAEEVSALTESKLIEPTSATYVNAYRSNYDFPNNTSFESDYFYTRKYSYNYTDNHKLGTDEMSIVSANGMSLHTGWGAGYDSLSVIIDGITGSGDKLQLHSSGSPSEAKPFTFVIDLGEVCTANRFVLYSQSRSDPMFPSAMNLYASTDGENFKLIGNYSDLKHSGNKLTIDFQETEMRYYKFEITKSTGSYIIIREVEMWKVFEISGGVWLTPDNSAFTYGGGWHIEQTQSTFGHVYVGSANAVMSFKFNGTRLALLSSEAYGRNFDVYIDGKKVNSIELKAITGGFGASYITEQLEDKEHTVVIKCTGEANIDSVVVYK
ncbi:MAG: M60 family metallopeptidase [Clostridia bacterium]|nr:M60 family metallopeptidase [Clostridia bacterium]